MSGYKQTATMISFFTVITFGCQEPEFSDDSDTADSQMDTDGGWSELAQPSIQTLEKIDSPTLQALAEYQLQSDFPGVHASAVLVAPSGITAYLFGTSKDTQHLTEGVLPSAPVSAVLIAPDGTCVGTTSDIGELVDDPGSLLSGDWERHVANHLDSCRIMRLTSDEVNVLASNLTAESRQFLRDLEHDDAPPSEALAAGCATSCGVDDGVSYGGQQAYSNGADTGASTSCTYANCSCGGVGTFGYLYQCVEYTERVHQRSDWAGNAYPGYWSQTGLSSGSTIQGPYYKSLLPLGSGTVYAAPQAGDIAVWSKSGTVGHVGVIASVGSSSVTVYDQNRKCGDQSCVLGYSGASPWTLTNGTASGYCGYENMGTYTLVGYLRRGWDFGATYGLAADSTSGTSSHNWWLNDASYVSGTTSNSVTDITDYITINPGPTDPYMTSPPGLKLPASTSYSYGYRQFAVYIKSDCANKTAAFYWKRTSDTGFSDARKVTATIVGNGWQTLIFDPSVNTYWSGTIDQVRLDPAPYCTSGSTDAISLQSAYFRK